MSQSFIKRLSTCSRGERAGLRATLRQDDQFPPRQAMRVVEDFIRDESSFSHRRKMYYLLAALYALRYPNPNQSETTGEPFAKVAARITKNNPNFDASKTGSLEKRFLHLLNSERDELAYPLGQWISLVKASGYDLDWQKLLKDLCWWNDRMKDDWARRYYRELKLNALPAEPLHEEEV